MTEYRFGRSAMVVFNNLNSVLWKHHLVLLVTWDFSKFGCLIFKSATAQDFRLHGSELFPPAKKERHLLLADVSLSWQGVTIQILSGRSNSLAFKFAIFLEKHLTGLLAGSAFAPYKRFTTGKTLAQGEFTSPEHFNH